MKLKTGAITGTGLLGLGWFVDKLGDVQTVTALLPPRVRGWLMSEPFLEVLSAVLFLGGLYLLARVALGIATVVEEAKGARTAAFDATALVNEFTDKMGARLDEVIASNRAIKAAVDDISNRRAQMEDEIRNRLGQVDQEIQAKVRDLQQENYDRLKETIESWKGTHEGFIEYEKKVLHEQAVRLSNAAAQADMKLQPYYRNLDRVIWLLEDDDKRSRER